MYVQNLRILEETSQRKDTTGICTEYVTDFIFRSGIKPLSLYVIEKTTQKAVRSSENTL